MSAFAGRLVDIARVDQSLRSLAELAESLLGPHGHLIPVRNSVGGSWQTARHSADLLSLLHLDSPAANFVLRETRSLLDRLGDGGLLSIIVACRVTLAFKDRPPREPADRLIERSLATVDRVLPTTVVSSDLPLSRLLAFGRSLLHRKLLLSEESLSSLLHALISSLVCGLPDSPSDIHFRPPLLLFLTTGSGPLIAETVPGLLLVVPHRRRVQQALNRLPGPSLCLRVLLIADGLSGMMADVGDVITSGAGVRERRAAIRERLHAWAATVAAAGVSAVFAQRVVEPGLRQGLARRGVMVLERLGAAKMVTLQACLNCAALPGPLGDLSGCVKETPASSQLRCLGEEQWALHLPIPGVTSLLVRPGVHVEARTAVEAALAGLCRVLTNKSRLCRGGGQWEKCVAREVDSEVGGVLLRVSAILRGIRWEEEEKEEEDNVWDEAEVKAEALKCGLRTAAILLRTDRFYAAT